ncbi:MAG: TSUP family transporter [Bdellovibrionales bacterium]|jgi:uncharacterized membrane protein YfcA|nr:TSUP family transporter [Bdellovibrionales bacterium]
MHLDLVPMDLALLIGGGFIAGVLDAIVGGGGLITVPIFLFILGPQASAIGTNKIAAVAAQLTAFAIYFKNRQVDFKQAYRIVGTTSLGAVLGALIAPTLPSAFFKWFLLIVAPIVLTLVFTKRLWNKERHRPRTTTGIGIAGTIGTFFAGLYDGVAGPGGGTMMFLSLFVLGGMPAAIAMGTGKLANLGSASLSLATFSVQGHVHWFLGTLVAIPIAFGAWIGARYSARMANDGKAQALARTALVIVSALLIARWYLTI